MNYYINRILEGEKLSFQQVIDKDAWQIKEQLIKDRDYNEILEPFKTVIWNAIKHKKVIRDPNKKRVDFPANKRRLSYSYVEFVQLTQELYAALDTFSKFHVALALRLFEKNLNRN